MADMEEMKCPEPMDKTPYSGINKLAGCNESERSNSLERFEPWWPSPCLGGEGNTSVRKVTDTPKMRQRGVSDDMLIRTWDATGETLLTPGRNDRKLGKRYNCKTGSALTVRGSRKGSK
jgi:hypothetical protein